MDFETLAAFTEKGKFYFSEKDKLAVECNAPNLPGIYIIYAKHSDGLELRFVGSSGTISQNGTFGANTLKHRMLIRRDGSDREEFLRKKLRSEHLDYFEIHWFVTFHDNTKYLPRSIEGCLIQEYFQQFQKLPPWNKEY
jgi:hypothetical protein